ncbi:hypothetical protein ACHAWF_018063 [Thalassiosira exigua]
MAWALLAFLAGRALGRRLLAECRRRPARWSRWREAWTAAGRAPFPPRRIACLVVGTATPLLFAHWGAGARSLGGWTAVRFLTGLIAGGADAWCDGRARSDGGDFGRKAKEDPAEDDIQTMEEGRALLSRPPRSSSEGEPESSPSRNTHMLDRKWLDGHWLAGAASSSLIGGWTFYPLNRLGASLGGVNSMLFLVGLGIATERCLVRHYAGQIASRATGSSKSDKSSVEQSQRKHQFFRDRAGKEGRKESLSSISSSQRRRQVQRESPRPSTFEFDEEQQITFHEQRPEPSPARHRSNSEDTDQFFDCLDDIDLHSGHDEDDGGGGGGVSAEGMAASAPVQSDSDRSSNESRIAAYSKRRVAYPDGSPALVPAGESVSTLPAGYLALYNNDRDKAQSKYRETQEWRREEKIYSVHSRPHSWFPAIKKAYPHVVHGFTPDGMPVVYESPGRMDLKGLFRGGCRVEDMIFHYCYLMEYLSNLEGVLTELHADDADDADAEWQEELAAYAHAKQQRLRSDPVPFGFCVVMDISGASPATLSVDVMTYLKRAGDVNTAHYPGSMRRAVAVRAPFWIGAAWKAIRGLLPASVTADLLSGAQTDAGELRRYVDEDQIPQEYGGRSRFKLGEHPFELGLKKLVETQEEATGREVGGGGRNGSECPLGEPESPLHAPAAIRSAPTVLERDVALDVNSPDPAMERTVAHEWEGLGSRHVLAVTTILQATVFLVVGALELALPYWAMTPPSRGGMGYEAHGNGTAVFLSCCVIAWAIRRPRMSQFALSTIEKSPLRGFRIGIGTTCFMLVCLGLIPIALKPSESTLILVCFSAYLSLIFIACSLGNLSLVHLRDLAVKPSQEHSSPQSVHWRTVIPPFGRAAGYICVVPIFRVPLQKGLPFPLNASFFLCLLACVCWLLYILSFSLHTPAVASPPPPLGHANKKEPQFIGAISSNLLFVREVFVVAYADVGFLVNELSQRDHHRTHKW